MSVISDSHIAVDPNDIAPSPSLSALRQLSIRTPSPTQESVSEHSSSTVTPLVQPIAQTVSSHSSSTVQSPRVLSPSSPSVRSEESSSRGPSIVSARSQQTQTAPSVPSKPASVQGSERPRSKLASLASSRAHTQSPKTRSEATGSFDDSGSAATFPVLRPSQGSFASTPTSLPTSVVQHQVEQAAALSLPSPLSPELERARTKMSRATRESVTSPNVDRPAAPIPSHSQSSNADAPTARPTSKLALLAQSKSADIPPKVKRPKVMGPPYAQTQYLTPTSNSSAMTTAITTYMQTPDTMLKMSRTDLPPSYPPVKPSGNLVSGGGGPGKLSKLAIKAKHTQRRPIADVEPTDGDSPDIGALPVDPIYGVRGAVTASPSTFADLLVNRDPERSEAAMKAEELERRSDEKRRRKHRRDALLPSHLLSSASSADAQGFAFDVPSPDDVVLNARRGTSLSSAQASTRHSAGHSSRLTSSPDTRSRVSTASVR